MHTNHVDNEHNVTQSESERTVRPNIELPLSLWKELKKAAIDRDTIPTKLLEDLVSEFLSKQEATARG